MSSATSTPAISASVIVGTFSGLWYGTYLSQWLHREFRAPDQCSWPLLLDCDIEWVRWFLVLGGVFAFVAAIFALPGTLLHIRTFRDQIDDAVPRRDSLMELVIIFGGLVLSVVLFSFVPILAWRLRDVILQDLALLIAPLVVVLLIELLGVDSAGRSRSGGGGT